VGHLRGEGTTDYVWAYYKSANIMTEF
jgi:hypothetical protein